MVGRLGGCGSACSFEQKSKRSTVGFPTRRHGHLGRIFKNINDAHRSVRLVLSSRSLRDSALSPHCCSNDFLDCLAVSQSSVVSPSMVVVSSSTLCMILRASAAICAAASAFDDAFFAACSPSCHVHARYRSAYAGCLPHRRNKRAIAAPAAAVNPCRDR
jgi:hypothetical protein